MKYNFVRAFVLCLCIFSALIVAQPSPHLVSHDELIAVIEQSNEQLAYIPDDIMGVVVRHTNVLKANPSKHLLDLINVVESGVDAASLDFLKNAIHDFRSALDEVLDSDDIQMLDAYKKALESGDALLQIKEDLDEDADTRRKKHKKIYCNLVVQNCLKANNLSVSGNAVFKGAISNCASLQTPQLIIQPCNSTTRAPGDPGCILFENSAGAEQARICSANDASTRLTMSTNGGTTDAIAIDSNGDVTVQNNFTVNPDGGTPTFFVDAASGTVFVNGSPISGGGSCDCSNLKLTPTSGNQSCVSYYEANGITLKGAVCSSPNAGDKGVYLSIDGTTQNLRITNTGNTQLSASASLRLTDSGGTNYAGLNAPATVPSSYTLSLPSAIPTANQVLRANGITPTNLEWFTLGGSAPPSSSEIIYVSKSGNDTTGNGSFSAPFLTVSKAITLANTISSTSTPVAIYVYPGIYTEDNSAGPLSITADGVTLIGVSQNATFIQPNTLANDLINATTSVRFVTITFQATGVSTANGVSLSGANNNSSFRSVVLTNFNVGVLCGGTSGGLEYTFQICSFRANNTGISINNTTVGFTGCTFQGSTSASPAGTALTATGSSARVSINACNCLFNVTGFNLTNSTTAVINGTTFLFNTNDIIQTPGSTGILNGCTFTLTTGNSDVKINTSGSGTRTELSSCFFHGKNIFGAANGTALQVTDQAVLNVSGGEIEYYTTGIEVGNPGDNSDTKIIASALPIYNCTNDLIQRGSSSVTLTGVSLSSNTVVISDPTNVVGAVFDLNNNAALNLGRLQDIDTNLILVATALVDEPKIDYKSSLYSTKAIGYESSNANQSTLFSLGTNNTNVTAITTDRTKTAGLRLVSDTAFPVGGTTALRGWHVNKNASTAELSFSYQNSDLVGQSNIPEYTVMQLDGVNNQVQLPNTATKMTFAGDTNLYRTAAALLKTDGNLTVGGLTGNRAVATNASSELISSATTDTELGYLSGTTSSVQTQLNNKVDKSGSTMTGTLTLAPGSTATPSLQFNGSTNTGLSAAAANVLAFSTLGNERMKIDSSGNVTIDGLSSTGVVHTNGSGTLSTSQVIGTDIANATIANSNLATISSADTSGYIVVRDGSGNFATHMITIDGTTTASTDVATKAYVDSVASTGLVIKTPALYVSTTDIGSPPSGPQTIDGFAVVTGNRVLLVGQANPIYNGLWVADTAANWTRPADFAVGSTAGEAYVLITSGNTEAGSAWVCSTPTAIVNTDPLAFQLFSLPDTTTAANVGAGAGQFFKNKTGNTLNFKTLATTVGSHINITNNSDDVTLTTDATNLNTASTIVARDASGNFSAGTITAALVGAASLNVLKAGDTMTGALQLPAGSTALPSLKFTGSTTTGLSAQVVDTLSFSTAATERMKIDSTGIVTIDSLAPTAGVVHNDASGALSSSLIVNADVDATAAIVDTKLATIATAGKVSNSATTATSSNTASAIVARDGSGNFSAGTISASLNGAASANVLKAGDTMSGALQLPAGTTAAPSLNFTGSTTTGLSASASNLSFSTSAVERMKISSAGTISIDAFTSAGVVHNDASGNLSSSLIVNADIDAAAAIVDTKLATISTAGKVSNSATTATSSNTANTIVARDLSGNFSAGTITATLTGTASGNLPTSGGTLTGNLTLPAGLVTAPSLNFTGSTTTGLSTPSADTLSLSTAGAERMKISPTGIIAINGFTTTGVVHNSNLGGLTTSLIVNADVDPAAAIVDTKLATISTAGKVSNSATTATSSNTANAIVARDASGNFSAGTITAALTGAASLNVLKAGDTMTGTLTHPAGSALAPSIQFTGSTNTGLSAATANTLSFDANGTEAMNLTSTDITHVVRTIIKTVLCNQGLETFTITANNQTYTTLGTTSILRILLSPAANRTGITINFPPNPTDGQYFTIVVGYSSNNSVTFTSAGGTGGATVTNAVTQLNPTNAPAAATGGTAVTFLYNASANTWYRISRG